jgi:hypothetical protein
MLVGVVVSRDVGLSEANCECVCVHTHVCVHTVVAK